MLIYLAAGWLLFILVWQDEKCNYVTSDYRKLNTNKTEKSEQQL